MSNILKKINLKPNIADEKNIEDMEDDEITNIVKEYIYYANRMSVLEKMGLVEREYIVLEEKPYNIAIPVVNFSQN